MSKVKIKKRAKDQLIPPKSTPPNKGFHTFENSSEKTNTPIVAKKNARIIPQKPQVIGALKI
jgi:hypothetical protein